MRRVLLIALAVNALLIGALGFVLLSAPAGAAWHGTAIEPPIPLRDFTLESNAGTFRLADQSGSLVVLFFGYTHCPDACPTTLAKLAQVQRTLPQDVAADVKVVLVTVDPERDTPGRLAEYVHQFDRSFTGVTGARADIEAIAKEYGIHQAHAHGAAGERGMIEHTTHTLVLDRTGALALLWSADVMAPQMAEDLRRLART
jgi:protein SCO1/2